MITALTLAMLVFCAHTPAILTRPDPGVFRIVQVKTSSYVVGTAFLVPGSGSRLLTANHVVEGGGALLVMHGNGAVPVIVMKRGSEEVDAAIVMTTGDDLAEINPLKWATEKPELGEVLWFLGWPAGVKARLAGPATVVSTDTRVLESALKGEFVTLVAPSLMPGHSGSPLFNGRGEIVGMMVKGATAGTPGGSIQLAIPAKVLRRFVR